MSENRVFNPQQLMTMSGDDPELAGQIAGIFLADIPKQLADLRRALAEGDLKTAERVAHTIKGSSATVGGEEVRDAALACERLGREGKLDDLKAAMPQLEACFSRMAQVLHETGYTELEDGA